MPTRSLCVLALLCCMPWFAVAQSSKPQTSKATTQPAPKGKVGPAEGMQKLVNDQIGFLTGSLNTTKPSPQVKEIGHKKGEKGETLTGYEFYAPGLPKNKNYSLLVWNIASEPYPAWKDVLLDNDGRALCRAENPYPLDVWLPAGRGEPKRFVLISDDGQSKAFMTSTPFPIEVKDKSCKVQAQLLVPDGLAYLVAGEGVQPNSIGHFVGESEGEQHFGAIKVDGGGKFYATFMPYVAGKSKGILNVQLKFDNCSPHIGMEWGDGTFHNN